MNYLVHGQNERSEGTRLPRVSAPVHGIDFSQMPPQCPSGAHLNSANRVDVSCDLNEIEERKGYFETAIIYIYINYWHYLILNAVFKSQTQYKHHPQYIHTHGQTSKQILVHCIIYLIIAEQKIVLIIHISLT